MSVLWNIIKLKLGNKSARRNVVQELRQTGGKRAVKPLIAALKDSDEYVCLEAARALGEIRDTGALKPLISALKDRRFYHLHREAAEALALIFETTSVETLFTVLKQSEKEARELALKALDRTVKSLELGPDIASLLQNGFPDVRLWAAETLAKIGDPRAVEPLIAWLKNGDCRDRYRATEALGKIKDGRVVEPLIAALEDSNEYVRLRAEEALERRKMSIAVEPLVVAVKDNGCRIRRWALKTLQRRENSIGEEVIVAALKSNFSEVRLWAAETLAKTGDARAVEPLIASLKDGDYHQRRRATDALDGMGAEIAAETLISTLRDSYSDVFEWAARALGKLGDARAVEPLIKALAESKSVAKSKLTRHGSSWALEAKPENAPFHEAEKCIIAAIKALGMIGDSRAVTPLVMALTDPVPMIGGVDFGDFVLQSLAMIGDGKAVELLTVALERGPLNQLVVEALGRVGGIDAAKELIRVATRYAKPSLHSGITEDREHDIFVIVPALERLLKKVTVISNLGSDDLRILAGLEGSASWSNRGNRGCAGDSHDKDADFCQVRQMARQELARRGDPL